jgi:hypothetical protein
MYAVLYYAVRGNLMRRYLRGIPFIILAAALASCGSQSALTPSSSHTLQNATRASGPSLNANVGGTWVHALLPRTARASSTSTSLPQYDLVYHGGPVQNNPLIYVVYWGFNAAGADPYGVAPYETSFLQGLSGTPYYNIMTQYYSTAGGNIDDPPHEYAGQWFDNTTPPNNPSDSQIAKEATNAAGHFGYSYDAVYVIQLPHGAYQNLKWCAYHYRTKSSYGEIHYADMPYQPDIPACGTDSVNSGAQGQLDSTSESVAHEVAETQTDPDAKTGWYDSSGNEIGDYCSYIDLQNITISTGTFATQPLWSNAANYCAIKYP